MVDHQNVKETDEALMCRVASGDRHSFETLVYRHQRQIFNFVFRFLADTAEAEDLTQEVFLRVWRSATTYRPNARFTTWLFRIATNLCINKQRALRVRKWLTVSGSHIPARNWEDPFVAIGGTDRTNAEDKLLQAEQSRQLLRALHDLPAGQRLALILKVYNGRSYDEISRIMNRSVAAIDSLLIRAKRNLRRKLTPQK